MALHGDNEGSGKADRSANVNPVSVMTEQLQEAYSKAGEDMAKQMAAAVVAIVAGVTSGQGLPGMSGWPKGNIPDSFKSIIPEDKLKEAMWVIIIAPTVNEIPLLQGNPIWGTELTSGHRLLVLG
jgi:hypothetical protein